MTLQIVAVAIACIAAAVSVAAMIATRRQAVRNRRAHKRTFQTGAVCAAYQPPATPEDSGLCARCGMYDYKHHEAP